MSMFCYQCEQAAGGKGCTVRGVCGKTDNAANLMDVLVEVTKGIAMYAWRAHQLGKHDRDVDVFVIEALFTTVTNVDFDPDRIEREWVRRAVAMRDRAKKLYEDACRAKGQTPESLTGPATWRVAGDRVGLEAQAHEVGIEARKARHGDDLAGLIELVVYGLKGAAAYMDHVQFIGTDTPELYAGFHQILDALTKPSFTPAELLGLAMQAGENNLNVMAALDEANTSTYGHPEPTVVRTTPVKGKCIVVSGHDLKDLAMLLEQTEGQGINVYTHGEMLPCLAYPELKKHKHLVGNYGGAWQNQEKEFDAFPGAVLMTTNCIQKPRPSYRGRIFTTGLVGWPDVTHITEKPDGSKDFTPVIEAALAAPGYAEDAPEEKITIGFARNAVMQAAGKVIELVKEGKIRHFFLVGGCDGAKPGRNYYTEFAQQVPDDCVILTLACGKFRFNKLDFGDIDGIPRLLDVGQCNDSYSAVKIALALADAFNCGVNDLPLSLVLSWYEQKAVAILLTLLHLGVQNIRLGPTLPAFVTPNVLQVLVDKFAIKPISTPEKDLADILGTATV